MIVYLKGEILEAQEDSVVILCGGVGYEVNLTKSAAAALTVGQQTALYVAESVSQFGETTLYGFPAKEDKELWQLFKTAIPKTGGKKAMELLGKALRSKTDFQLAICNRDPKILTGIFGFTAKTAEKLITSLKDHVDEFTVSGESKIKVLDQPAYLSGALEALGALGYSAAEARRALDTLHTRGLSADTPLEQLIKEALRVLKK